MEKNKKRKKLRGIEKTIWECITGLNYQDAVNWGKEGGRPRKYNNNQEKNQAYRARKKLKQGGCLSKNQRQLLGLIQPRFRSYTYHSNRPATAYERKVRWRLKKSQKVS